MVEIVIVIAAFFLGSFVQGLTGFGAALVAIPFLTMALDIKVAVPLLMLTGLIINTYMGIKLRNHFDRKKIIPICIGSLPGIVLGAILLKIVPSDTIRFIIGLLLVVYSLYCLFFSPKARNLDSRWGYLAGFFTGFFNAMLSAGGPPSIVYATMNNWTKDQIKATLTGVFLFNAYFGATVHALSGITTLTVLKYFFFSVPAVLLGIPLGIYCYGYFGKGSYLKLIYGLLTAMGIMLMI